MARLVTASLAATGSVVVPLDPHKAVMLIRPILYGSSSTNAANRAQVDATISDLGNNIAVTVSRATTVITVTFPTLSPHKLGNTTDYLIISGTGNAALDGTYPIATVTSDTVVTVTASASGTIAATAGYGLPIKTVATVIASALPPFATAPLTFAASTDTGLVLAQVPFSAYILKQTVYTSTGTTYLDVRQEGIAP